MDAQDLGNRFNYHPPSPDRALIHDAIRGELQEVAQTILDSLPAGREQSLAVTKLEEAMFWANAALARQGE